MPAKTNHLPVKDTGIPLHQPYTSSAKYVCFKCRICFHRPYNAGVRECGTCKAPTHYAGNAFRAPRKTKIKEWAKLEILIKDGVRFNYYGGNGILPATAKEARMSRRRRKLDVMNKLVYAKRLSNGKRVVRGPSSGWDNSVYSLPVGEE